jgi:hypothetical protein
MNTEERRKTQDMNAAAVVPPDWSGRTVFGHCTGGAAPPGGVVSVCVCGFRFVWMVCDSG